MIKCKYAERGCTYKHDWAPSLAIHEKKCEYRPKRGRPKTTVANATLPDEAFTEAKKTSVSQVKQAINLEVAAVMVLAAKYPKGIKLEEYPHAVQVIQAVVNA
jgi:hypothetical protein